MAENELMDPSTAAWSDHLVDAPDNHFLNGYEEHFDGFLIPFVDEGNDPEMKSALDLHGIGGAQSILSIPALGLMDGSVVEGRPNRSETCDLPAVDRFVCSHCGRRFKSQNDVDRHRSSVHDKSTPYFCNQQGCPRSRRGFTRKDNYETHLRRHAHTKLSKDANQIVGQDIKILSHVGPRTEVREHGLEGCSWEKLAEIVMNEREKCKIEKQRRQEVEEELKNLRQRYEEREDMWLKLLLTKEGGK